MTCIAAIIADDGTAHIACDSLGSNLYTKNVYRTPKIFHRDGMLFGFTSSYRMGQLLQYSLDVPPRKIGQDIDTYLHVDLIDAVKKTFSDGGFGSAERGGEFLITAESRIFTVQGDFSLLESIDPFESCGSGEDYARAALFTMAGLGVTDCESMLRDAIETAAHYTTGVGGTVHHLQLPERKKGRKSGR